MMIFSTNDVSRKNQKKTGILTETKVNPEHRELEHINKKCTEDDTRSLFINFKTLSLEFEFGL